MKKMFSLLAAGAIALSPAMTLAGPGGHGGGPGHGATISSMGGSMGQGRGAATAHGGAMGRGNSGSLSTAGPDASHSSMGPVNGKGWDHMNGPTSTGQPGVECEDGVPPGNASSARGSAFNEDGVGHSHYAGEQPQNSRNSASSSQYDTACLRPQH